jgi:hypothetical protein
MAYFGPRYGLPLLRNELAQRRGSSKPDVVLWHRLDAATIEEVLPPYGSGTYGPNPAQPIRPALVALPGEEPVRLVPPDTIHIDRLLGPVGATDVEPIVIQQLYPGGPIRYLELNVRTFGRPGERPRYKICCAIPRA